MIGGPRDGRVPRAAITPAHEQLPHEQLPHEQLLEMLQREAFTYFAKETNDTNGLVVDRTEDGAPSSIAAVGLGLTACLVAVERGFLSREDAIRRTLACVRFFWKSPQGTAPDATGYKGFYYHFLDMRSGRRAGTSELSSVDTALLLAGMLATAQYFTGDTAEEREIRSLVDELVARVDWQWMLNDDITVSYGWTPEHGFLPYRWRGYNEALLLYILALGSPGHAIPEESYTEWTRSYAWKTIYGYDVLYSGPLFTHQLSHIWIDFRGIQDAFMRTKGVDYFENSRRATYIQQQYAVQNPLHWTGYSATCWGLTATAGPGPYTCLVDGIERHFYGYVARGAPFGPDDGTIAPWVVVASIPFAPEIAIPAIEHFNRLPLRETNPYGFKPSFNETFRASQPGNACWIAPWHCGLNQGPIVLMIENYRTELVWTLMKRSPVLIAGLRRAGFTHGWLDHIASGTD